MVVVLVLRVGVSVLEGQDRVMFGFVRGVV